MAEPREVARLSPGWWWVQLHEGEEWRAVELHGALGGLVFFVGGMPLHPDHAHQWGEPCAMLA